MSEVMSRLVVIRNKLGLHARAASMLVRLAGGFQSEINLEKDGVRANAKSIMGILMMAAGPGSSLLVTAQGEDAAEALDALVKLIEVEAFNEL